MVDGKEEEWSEERRQKVSMSLRAQVKGLHEVGVKRQRSRKSFDECMRDAERLQAKLAETMAVIADGMDRGAGSVKKIKQLFTGLHVCERAFLDSSSRCSDDYYALIHELGEAMGQFDASAPGGRRQFSSRREHSPEVA